MFNCSPFGRRIQTPLPNTLFPTRAGSQICWGAPFPQLFCSRTGRLSIPPAAMQLAHYHFKRHGSFAALLHTLYSGGLLQTFPPITAPTKPSNVTSTTGQWMVSFPFPLSGRHTQPCPAIPLFTGQPVSVAHSLLTSDSATAPSTLRPGSHCGHTTLLCLFFSERQ